MTTNSVLKKTVRRLKRANQLLSEKIDEWKSASSLTINGDPSGVEPEHLAKYIDQLILIISKVEAAQDLLNETIKEEEDRRERYALEVKEPIQPMQQMLNPRMSIAPFTKDLDIVLGEYRAVEQLDSGERLEIKRELPGEQLEDRAGEQLDLEEDRAGEQLDLEEDRAGEQLDLE